MAPASDPTLATGLARFDVLATDRGIATRHDVPLGPLTTLRVGGPADRLAEPRSRNELLSVLDAAREAGVPWLVIGNGSDLVVADAVISPSGCGNIYMNATPRVIYGWAQTGTFFKYFTSIDEQSGIPRPALWLTFGLAVFWTLPFPSWEALINVVSAALVLSYAVAPVSVAALRRSAPDMARPFRVKGMGVLGPLSFIIAANRPGRIRGSPECRAKARNEASCACLR